MSNVNVMLLGERSIIVKSNGEEVTLTTKKAVSIESAVAEKLVKMYGEKEVLIVEASKSKSSK